MALGLLRNWPVQTLFDLLIAFCGVQQKHVAGLEYGYTVLAKNPAFVDAVFGNQRLQALVDEQPQLLLFIGTLSRKMPERPFQEPSMCARVCGWLSSACFALLSTPLSGAGFREWTSDNGAFKVEAELIAFDGEVAQLRKHDGDILKVPVRRLSVPDREFSWRELVVRQSELITLMPSLFLDVWCVESLA